MQIWLLEITQNLCKTGYKTVHQSIHKTEESAVFQLERYLSESKYFGVGGNIGSLYAYTVYEHEIIINGLGEPTYTGWINWLRSHAIKVRIDPKKIIDYKATPLTERIKIK